MKTKAVQLLFLLAGLGLACQKEKLALNQLQTTQIGIPKHRSIDTIPSLNRWKIKDIDGNIYRSVKIGNQIWMVENLKVTRYRNGSPINLVHNSGNWARGIQGSYCWYDDNIRNKNDYGALYNWYAVNNSQQLAPEGWHIPSLQEWETLINYLDGADLAGGALKEAGYAHWFYPNIDASDDYGFKALPGGGIGPDGAFHQLYKEGLFWTSTYDNITQEVNYVHMSYNHGRLIKSKCSKSYGFSVRCIKDASK